MIDYLDQLTVDWSDFEKAGEQTREVLAELAADKPALRALVYGVEDDQELLASCERHQLLDYLVVYGALERGFRLRVHVSTDDHFDRPHDHRFSFSSLILRGGYTHTWHHCDTDLYPTEDDEEARRYDSRHNPDPRGRFDVGTVTPYLTRMERSGSCYSLHHTAIHTTFTTPDTVSLFLRGPAEKNRSVIMDKQTNTLWWRFGRDDETAERRADKPMGLDYYRHIRTRLEALEVI